MDFGRLAGMMMPMLQRAASQGNPAMQKIVQRVEARTADLRAVGEAAGGLVRVT
ncbi:unnamed protein product, partial [Symbiodinium sp. KB8]